MKKLAIFALAFALVLSATPVLAGTRVTNRNSAFVGNTVTADSNTGGNYAGGADTGNGGNAGDIDNNGDGDVEESTTGNGGAGGDISGDNSGGTVVTGNAVTVVVIGNDVNSNRTLISSDCGCDETRTSVRNKNRAVVLNGVYAGSNTGDNKAKGADTGNGGSGGDIDNGGYNDDGDVKESDTGNGGAAGDISGAESGGYVETFDATTQVRVINVVNRNVTRVLRSSSL